jgi:biopolymer transport protein ExbD
MARDFKRKNKLAVISDLNVTPLIDLAFSLLIIFMITTPVIEQYNRIDLPDQPSEQDQPLPAIDDEFITIDAEGTYHWGQVKVSKDELEERLDRIAASSGEQPVIHLRGDRSLRYQKIFDVINMLKVRNLTKLSLDTKAI